MCGGGGVAFPFSDHSYISGEKGGDEGQGKACHLGSLKVNVMEQASVKGAL